MTAIHALLKVYETTLYVVHRHVTDRVVMTILHAGGKFGGGGCAVLIGLHGACQE